MSADPDKAREWQRSFGGRVRSLRQEQGLSQMALSHEIGVHPTYLSGIERGERNVSLVNIHRIAAALGVGPTELFGGSSAPKAE